MPIRRCDYCGTTLGLYREGARFCSTKCRVYWHRKGPTIPRELTERATWTRARGKRPITVYGAPASSTNPETWAGYNEVVAGRIGDGYGVMLGAGLGCWDLDHCLDEHGRPDSPTVELLRSIEAPVWVERSMSGDGLHVFVRAAEGPGWRRGTVEFYSRARFIRVTGDRFPIGGL